YDIDGQPQHSHNQDEFGMLHLQRPEHPGDRLHQDGEVQGYEEGGVAERPHHLSPGEAIRGDVPPLQFGHVGYYQPDQQGHGVGEHREGVGEDCEGLTHVPRHQLGHEAGGGEDVSKGFKDKGGGGART
uniref:Uncharacterized protein n=1 Tax=Callorhinchus milii TaxID=7868 RepID=A0A4W3KC52_CALMI